LEARGKAVSLRRRQQGYLFEIPLLLVVVGVVLAILLPNLSALGQRILSVIAVPIVLFCLYYMIVVPGWTPDDTGRLKPPWSLLLFLLIAVPIIAALVMFLLQ